MFFTDKKIYTEQFESWTLDIFELAGDSGQLALSVEMLRDGHRKGRLTLSRPSATPDESIAALRARGISWTLDHSRDHTDIGLADL